MSRPQCVGTESVLAPLVRVTKRMTDFRRQPGGIDDPGMKGGIDPEQRPLPPGDTAGDTGGSGEPTAAELDLPGPDDPVAWSYVEEGTRVVGPDGEDLGKVLAMLGTETENIFHGVAVRPADGGDARVVPADAVTRLTTSKVEVAWGADQLKRAEEYTAIGG
jgi:hypothetical protein